MILNKKVIFIYKIQNIPLNDEKINLIFRLIELSKFCYINNSITEYIKYCCNFHKITLFNIL